MASAVTYPARFQGLKRRRGSSLIVNWWLVASSCYSCQGYLRTPPTTVPRRTTRVRRGTLWENWIGTISPRRRCGQIRLYSNKSNHHNTQQQRRVCVLHSDQADQQHVSQVAGQVSQSLSLPLVTMSQLLLDMQQSESPFTHMLCVLDFEEGRQLLLEDDNRSSCYALAIQPLFATPPSGGAKKRRQQQSTNKKPKLPKMKPHWIDLCPPTVGKRSSQPDLLLQAVAPQRGGGATVIDLTAGWAQDSLLLALGGASHVTMVERDPIVATLLQDALRRLELIAQANKPASPASRAWQQRAQHLAQTLTLHVGDARHVLQNTTLSEQPDIVYLDPMFPPRSKTAAVKKGMQILHGLFQSLDENPYHDATILEEAREQEEMELLQIAYQQANVKVVVKRPLNAPALGGNSTALSPSQSVRGSTNRWDIYLKN